MLYFISIMTKLYYREKNFEVETIEKIRTADTPEKIFDMIHFKELTLAVNQMRIIGKCDYYCIDYGVSITSNGTVYAGSGNKCLSIWNTPKFEYLFNIKLWKFTFYKNL